jgi:hypothetical protein
VEARVAIVAIDPAQVREILMRLLEQGELLGMVAHSEKRLDEAEEFGLSFGDVADSGQHRMSVTVELRFSERPELIEPRVSKLMVPKGVRAVQLGDD